MDYSVQLKGLPRQHDFFVGIDSDGCVFDNMEFKQKECFCPAVITHMQLQAVSKAAREVWECVNLYSRSRGCNRFMALERFLRLMRRRPEVSARHVAVPALPALSAWLRCESKLGNPALAAAATATGDPDLARVLEWSLEINRRVTAMNHGITPFPGVREVLQQLADRADVIVVSQTPLEALRREWRENRIDDTVALIAGQEYGTKTEHLRYAAGGKGYAADHLLMIGDAPGDYRAAQSNNALFFPIVPGKEEESWQELGGEGLGRFFAGTFAGAYQQQLLAAFDRALPEVPEEETASPTTT
ncbi:MAG: HAD hydrolase-like protein [Victivallales bacterium]|nr:HAD hydrolase-like protein [Victivallales bacterium]